MGASEARKEPIRKYKEQKVARGIFAVRSTLTGSVWVGASRNLVAEKNGCWFALRIGAHVNKGLQSEWNARGEQALVYEVLETLKDDVHPLELADLLKARRGYWVGRLGALAEPPTFRRGSRFSF